MVLFNKKNKAQVSAPFEILIAIIIMGFVIVAGNGALMSLSKNSCLGNKRQDFSNFVSVLRDVTFGSDLTYKTLTFQTPACFDSKGEHVTLKTYIDSQRCATYCGSGNNCLLLEYKYTDKDNRTYIPIPPICTHLPSTLTFETETSLCTDNTDHWVAINPLAGDIPNGKYKLFKENYSGSYTRICLLKQK